MCDLTTASVITCQTEDLLKRACQLVSDPNCLCSESLFHSHRQDTLFHVKAAERTYCTKSMGNRQVLFSSSASLLISPVVCWCEFYTDSAAQYWWKKGKKNVLFRQATRFRAGYALSPRRGAAFLQAAPEKKQIWWSFDFSQSHGHATMNQYNFPRCFLTQGWADWKVPPSAQVEEA